MIVTTQPVRPGQLVASFAGANIVRTTLTSGRYREIGDDELLALASPRPAALVRHGPHEAELILIDLADE